MYLEGKSRVKTPGNSQVDSLISLIGDGERYEEVSIILRQRPLLRHLYRQQHGLGGVGRLSGGGGGGLCPRGRGGVRRWPG
jgi:hypothetical protein